MKEKPRSKVSVTTTSKTNTRKNTFKNTFKEKSTVIDYNEKGNATQGATQTVTQKTVNNRIKSKGKVKIVNVNKKGASTVTKQKTKNGNERLSIRKISDKAANRKINRM